MTAIVPFAFEDNLVRVVDRNDEPWFVGSDVCRALGVGNTSQALSRLDPDERGIISNEGGIISNDTPGRSMEVSIVSEAGVYRLVFTSRKPEAERFKRWLAHEVLPQIRKHGVYRMPGRDEPGRDEPSLDGEPVSTLKAKLDLLRECRLIFGADKARRLWGQLGLPSVPVEAAAGGVDAEADGLAALKHLMGQTLLYSDPVSREDETLSFADMVERALDGDEDQRFNLILYGIRIEEPVDGEPMVWIANRGGRLARFFAGTKWANAWRLAWRGIPGAHSGTKVYKVDQLTTAGWSIPIAALDLPA